MLWAACAAAQTVEGTVVDSITGAGILKTLIAGALEREISQEPSNSASMGKRRRPVIHLRHRATVDLTGFDFDDLLT